MAYIKCFVNGLLYPIRHNQIYFIFIYTLGCLTSLCECLSLNFKIQRFNFFSCFLDVYLLCVLITLIPQKMKGLVKGLVAIILYALSFVELFCVDKFSARITPEILNVVLETNSRESSEFLHQYIDLGLLLSGVGVVFFIMILHISTFGCFHQLKRFHRSVLNVKYRFFLFVTKILIVSMVIFSAVLCLKSRVQLAKLMLASTVEETDRYVSNFSENTPLNNLLFSIKMHQLSNVGLDDLIAIQDAVEIEKCSFTSDNIILIIGESYIRCHSQLYGYHLSTTPRQLYRRDNPGKGGRLVVFTDVISPSNLTSIVFKNMFSLYSLDGDSKWSESPLFPVLFRKAGYNVMFLTNQFVSALNTDIFNVSGGLFLNEPKLSAAQFSYRNTQTHQYDLSLLDDYESLKRYNSNHQLTIFHLAGQHIYFSKRCPPHLKQFSVSDYSERNSLSEGAKQLVADYDNATYYNDLVVDSIIRRFEKDNAIIVYLPDHGEECYDELQRVGRLPANNCSPEVLRQEYRIPFWIWCSERYIQTHQQLCDQIINSANRPFMTDDLPHLLLYLAGIKCVGYDEERNLISEGFNMNRKRLINGKIDYDSVVSRNNRK